MITGSQIKAARCLLGWNQTTLANRSKVSIASIKRIEPTFDVPATGAKTLEKIEQTFKNAGVNFQNKDDKLGLFLSFKGARP